MDTRYVGWRENYLKDYYDPSVIAWISDAVMLKTMGLDKRPIRVSEENIKNSLDTVLLNHRAYPGDIFTRYNMPSDGNFSGDFGVVKSNNFSFSSNVGFSSNYILNQVVEYISEYIKSDYEINTNNKKFSRASTLYGANDLGLRAHSQIKIREKRPTPFQFHMKF